MITPRMRGSLVLCPKSANEMTITLILRWLELVSPGRSSSHNSSHNSNTPRRDMEVTTWNIVPFHRNLYQRLVLLVFIPPQRYFANPRATKSILDPQCRSCSLRSSYHRKISSTSKLPPKPICWMISILSGETV